MHLVWAIGSKLGICIKDFPYMISAENIGLSWSIRNRNCLCQQYFHYIREKLCTFVESLSYIITTMIGYNSLNGFTKDYNMWNGNDKQQTMDGRKVISIANITLWIMWANINLLIINIVLKQNDQSTLMYVVSDICNICFDIRWTD